MPIAANRAGLLRLSGFEGNTRVSLDAFVALGVFVSRTTQLPSGERRLPGAGGVMTLRARMRDGSRVHIPVRNASDF